MKKTLLIFQLIFVLGIAVSTVIPSFSLETFNQDLESEQVISPKKHDCSFKATEAKAERSTKLALRDQFRPKFLKLIALTLGFVFHQSVECKPFSKQLSYGLLFSESYLKLFDDPSSHPIRPQAPPVFV